VQCDIDIIGEPGPLAELELLTATIATLDALGLGGCTIRLNDRRVLGGILTSWNVPDDLRERALITIDKLDKIGTAGVAAELVELGAVDASTDVAAQLEALTSADWHLHDGVVPPPAWLDLDAYRDLLALRAALPDAAIEFDPTLVRGMGYYTGTIFEIAHPDFGYSLGGGGRYDHMIGRFLGQEVPACGFSLGLERIIVVMAERGMFPAAVTGGGVDVVVTFMDDESRAEALALARALRDRQLRVDVFPDASRKFDKPLKYASARGAKLMAILGENEREKGEVSVRDLTTREQTAVSRGDALAFVRKHLAP